MSLIRRTYLDYNATAPLRPEARDALVAAYECTGNASSVHSEGRAARARLENARDALAALVGGQARGVIFTSGGTEANNFVLSREFRRGGGAAPDILLVGGGEHPCVLEGHRFANDAIERIPLTRDGVVDLAWLSQRLTALTSRTVLVSIQLANNETGVVQPVAKAARIVREHGGLIHTDAVQAAGKIPISFAELGVDAMTLSAHKLGGPQGVGALVLASEGYHLGRMVRGGGQERGWRAGTENVAAISAFGEAARAALAQLPSEASRLAALRAAFEAEIRRIAPDAVIFGEAAPRLPNTILFAVPGWKAEMALIAFDLNGVALSSGSACSSGKVRRSHVLDAMGIAPDLAEGAIRLSFGWASTEADVTSFASAFEKTLSVRNDRKVRAA
jgi:cysteine desulfurase